MTAFASLIESSRIWYFLVTFVYEGLDITGGILLSFIIMRERPKRKVYPYVLLFLFCVVTAVFEVFNLKFNEDIGYILAIISPLIILKLSKKKSWKFCLLSFSYDLLVGIITTGFIAVLGKNYDQVSDNYETVCLFVVSVVLGVILLIIADIAARKTDSEALLAKIKLPLIFLVIITATFFSFTIIHFQINFASRPTDFWLNVINIILFSVTIVYAVKSFIKSKIAEENFKNQLSMQIQHFEMLEKKNDELRIFRHDISKKLRPLWIYLDERNYEEAKNILTDFNIEIEKSKPRFDTGNYRLDAVLESQQQLAEKNNISITYVGGSVFPKEGISPEDIYTIFLNALDNSIEACIKTGKRCEILFESHIIHKQVYIKISNPFSSEINICGEKLITTKADKENHGYGFKSIKKAAAKYGSENVKFEIENGVFILKIILNLPK